MEEDPEIIKYLNMKIEDNVKDIDNLVFVEDNDYLRKGFYIDSRDSNPVKSSDLPNQEQNGK